MSGGDGHQTGVIAVIERDGRWLMIRRAEGVIAPGYWCFPGGGVEAGETQAQAVVREIREELGLDVVPVRELWRWRRPDKDLLLVWWQVRLADENQPPLPSAEEVAEVRWVKPADLRRLEPALESNHRFLDFHERQTP